MKLDTNKVIISTTLSNIDLNFYDDNGLKYNNEIICKYLKTNDHQLINNVFSQFIDSVYFNNKYSTVPELLEFESNSVFYVRYNISLKLKELNDLMFNSCNTLYSITNIGSNFRKIGKYVFNGCSELQYVDLPKNIKEIDSFAFNGTNKLKQLNVSNVVKLHNYAFAGCGIESIELNNSITNLPHYLFKDCKQLKTFTNDKIMDIGEGVFCGCKNLEYVQLSWVNNMYNKSSEYKEEAEATSTKFISKEYDISVYIKILYTTDGESGEESYLKIGDYHIMTLENNLDDGDHVDDLKFKILSILYENDFADLNNNDDDPEEDPGEELEDYTQYRLEVGSIYYVSKNILIIKEYNEETGEAYAGYKYVHDYFNNNQIKMVSKIKLKTSDEPGGNTGEDEPGTEIIPVTRYELYDANGYQISNNISESLANKIKNYLDSYDEHIADFVDDNTGIGRLILLNEIPIYEYYNDGIHRTGKVMYDASSIGEYDSTQMIKKYVNQTEAVLEDNQDIDSHLVFADDFSYINIKLNGFPVYDPTETYVIYNIYEPFLSIRRQYNEQLGHRFDENLIPIESKYNQAYKDLGFHKVENDKWPVYNYNYCFIGLLTNDQILFYTNQNELDTYHSSIDTVQIIDDNGDYTNLQYFMLVGSNYSESDLMYDSETIIEELTNIIKQILGIEDQSLNEEEAETESIITDSFGSQTPQQIEELTDVLVFNNNSSNKKLIEPIEEEEELITYNKFNINNLSYNKQKISLSNYLFAGCIKLSNDNIVRIGNLNTNLNRTKIKFNNYIIDNNEYYNGEWIDIVSFNFYNPSTVNYKYSFKWKKINTYNSNYIQIVLNDKLYFIIERYIQTETFEGYKRYLVRDIYDNPTSDDFNGDEFNIDIENNISLFNTNITNTTYNIVLPKYSKSIYDTYPLLDIIENIGKGTFMNCSSITDIYNRFISIDEFGFKDCINLKSIDLSRTRSIGNYAFMNCKSLSTINLALLSANNISEGIFCNCSNLTTINNLNLNYISRYTFKNCYNLGEVNLTNVLEIDNEAFLNCYNMTLKNDLLNNIKNIQHVKIIGDYAFCNCKNITEINFNTQIESIGKAAFKGCDGILNIELPNTISEFTPEMFAGCSNLKSIKFNTIYVPTNSDNDFELSALDYCNSLQSIEIPEGGIFTTTSNNDCIINKITHELLYVCKDIQVFKIGKDITKINDYAFNNSNVSIIEIDKDANIENINKNTFANIKNKNYHILIDKQSNEEQYQQYLNIVGKRHLYYK